MSEVGGKLVRSAVGEMGEGGDRSRRLPASLSGWLLGGASAFGAAYYGDEMSHI